MSDDQTPKIIVDDDWKSQARAEKEKLKTQVETTDDADAGFPDKVSFPHLLELLVTQTLMYLGAFPDPTTGKAMIALDAAKFHIDLLGIVEERTRGNLSEEEERQLKGVLHELRVQFVEISKAIAKAAKDGTLRSNDPTAKA